MSANQTDAVNNYGNVMLVNLSIRQWTARKIDKRAADEVNRANDVSDAAHGTYYKSLIASDILTQISQVASRARTYHYYMTLPWLDNGLRVLPARLYFDYMEEMRKHAEAFIDLAEQFVERYPFEREEAKRLLGKLFNESDYPTAQDVSSKFHFAADVMPLPIGDDFRCQLGNPELEAQIRADVDAKARETMAQASRDVVERVAKVVGAFVDRLGDPERRFEASLVDNARQLVEVLPALNINNDPDMAAMCDRIRNSLCAHDAPKLRSDLQARRETYEAAVAMRKDLGAFFGFGQ